MHNILIIGAGQLGSRHLQGALLSPNELKITVIDPSSESLNIAKERAGQVEYGNKNSTVSYSNELPLNENVDVCIIATAAQVRAAVTKQLLDKNQVEHIVFEKVLFQKIADYSEISALLAETSTTGWVNCPRRLFPTYTALKQQLDTSKPINMVVDGHAWGMACNSVHFLDVFAFLAENSTLELVESKLDSELIESKRVGFYETTGQLSFTAGNHTLTIQSGQEETPQLSVSLVNGETRFVVNEVEGVWTKSQGEDTEQFTHKPLFQSQLTGGTVDQLLSSNTCGLTPFEQSCNLHVPFINALLVHMSAVLEKELDACPIT
ncbi:Gfo/Idh/MocA family oxidoreductase [Vibrio gallaecicus]|uniref:Gfo/Idh/MocA family oxidoreductase n=1 Tax=Vibrio gallaecicus TaxID=552386 RepID=UPI0010CA0DC7|nr:Gfo/Idh/MocA family oxidoreductase [Vibrio gallaecicus]MDN3614789.1 Gfo/Idh/MocA family oxidoreductase [Vibrio gallaecicus]